MIRNISRFVCSLLSATIATMSLNISMVAHGDDTHVDGLMEDKISIALSEKMQDSSDTDTIPVWVWFTDIDNAKLEKKVNTLTGLSVDSIEATDMKIPFELENALENVQKRNSPHTAEMLKAYLDDTRQERDEEKNKVEIYNHAKRAVSADELNKWNQEILQEFEVSDEDVLFQSTLTPSAIINVTKEQVERLADADDVISIDLYENDTASMCPPTSQESALAPIYGQSRATMRVDDVLDATGLTGSGINVMVFDHGWVSADQPGFNNVNSSNVYVVSNETIYNPATETELFYDPDVYQSSHPNTVASVLQYFAKDVTIFSVAHDALSDVEWAICNCDIDVINGSINFGCGDPYSEQAIAKWCDYIINQYNISFLAAGGNGRTWSGGTGWPKVIIPASCYNCIAVGAYNPSTKIMQDFRYNPTDSTEYVNYKPDIVVASPSTSEGTPMATGIVSLMLQLKPSLAVHPDLIKAILMASCHEKAESIENVASETMAEGLTQRQGAGAIDAYTAISIVLQGRYGISEVSANSGYDEMALPYSGDNCNINFSIAWLYKGIDENEEFRDGNSISNATYSMGSSLKELELDVINSNQDIVSRSARKNTGKQLAYFTYDTLESQYLVHVADANQNNDTIEYAYAWSTCLDGEDTIVRKKIKINNALSNHDIDLETDILFDNETINGNITEHNLFGLASAYNNSNISIDGETLFSFGDVNLLELSNDYSGTYQLQDSTYVNYNISNNNGDYLITVYDNSSLYVEIEDYADAVSSFRVQNNRSGQSVTTEYTNSSYVPLSSPIHIDFYDKNHNWFASASQVSFIETVGYISGIDAAYKLSSNNANGRSYIMLGTYDMGDVTLDGIVDENDSITLLRYIVSFYNFIQTGSTGDLTLGNGNITVNGNISANGTFSLNASNANINGQLSATSFVNNITGNLNMNHPQNNLIFTSDYVQALFSDEKMMRMYFSDTSVNTISSDYIINDTNIFISTDTVVEGEVALTGNASINSNLKATGDILINGDVSNTINGIIYSQDGDITLNSNNINYSGLIYAPNGTVTLEGSNITITGTIIAKELIIDGSTVNFNVAAVDQGSSGDMGSALTLTEFQLMLGDLNYDRDIDIVDVIMVNKKIHGVA